MTTDTHPMQTYGIAATLDQLIAEVAPQIEDYGCNPDDNDAKKLATQIVDLVAARIFERLANPRRIPVRTCEVCGFTGQAVIATRTDKGGETTYFTHCIDPKKCEERHHGN